MRISTKIVEVAGNTLARRSSRRGFLARSAVVGSALAVNPFKFALRPGTAYASLCGPAASCSSGWTVFCCSINKGSNSCPPGTIPAGWWKTDRSSFCDEGPRYILDCNAKCGGCGCGGGGICGPSCYSCGCRCGTGSCDQRLVCCNEFRYGQCHQEVACVGPVVCRVASCRPPWELDPTCTRTPATANETALHTAPCLDESGKAFVTAFGPAPKLPSPKQAPTAPVVGMAASPTGKGYWLVAADGGVFALGDAKFYGSTGGRRLNRPIVGMAATLSGKGYWLVGADGRIYAFGSARSHGGTGAQRLNRPIVGIARTPTGRGYWLVASDGGIFAFGDARYHGSAGNIPLKSPIVGMAATRSGNGYWMVAADGGVFAFGDAKFYGSTGGRRVSSPIVGMARRPAGRGYWLVAADGRIFAFGESRFFGGLVPARGAKGRAVGMAGAVDGGYWIASQR